ncbi:cell envelope biogenesis protein TolA [Bradyrhizobium lablabi]|uniref:Cell envelope biogenesis protein TolA n=1 Tax=Bradyrhizobium lablabi TaxID=722472 RepID=A0A0R3MYR9_9BRAD|nr:hypothetical protein [Bradyrhizobium lablabi]KRR25239.1 cell envelope biogenesis protein TolA [Bradyrhizobium lablabi]
MARKLKTYQTSLGFFDLAIAAPSMKSALEAWGADSNLFHQGVAKQSDDPDVIAATMAKPGVVLRRPVGSVGSFSEHAELPIDLGGEGRQAKGTRKSASRRPKKPRSRPVDKASERKAALDDEREQRRRERERANEEAARRKDRERRQQAADRAQAALDKAKREHAKRAEAIEAERAALEKKCRAEDDRWDKERGRLEAALRRARG